MLPGLPVLRRQPGEIQIGLDPRHAAVVSGLPEPVVTIAMQLTGHHTIDALMAKVEPPEREVLGELVLALAGQGLLQDADDQERPALAGPLVADGTACALRWPAHHPAARRELAVAVHGDGRLAVTIGCLLVTAGIGWVHVAARGTVRPEDTGTGYRAEDVGRRRAAAAKDALLRADATVRAARFRTRRPDLVLLTDAMVPDPELVAGLFVDAVPHLPVRVREGFGVVGPLVVPGATSCLRCADLRRTELDRCWPDVAAQLAGRAQLADLAGTQATAALAVAQALEALRWGRTASDRPVTWNTSVEIDPFAATTQYRRWDPHPECPCGVAGRSRTG